ncbi:MAG: hypothetical protein SOX26_11830, partial [Phocaeicola sp.]|nr:hypothetical protein [Phocaeicola sp.]
LLTGSLILRLKNIGNFYLIGGERINGDKIIINPFFIICNVESWRRLRILRSFDCLFKKTVFREDKIKVSNKRRKSENKTLNKSTVK